jgi:hypothetical protein
VAMQARPRDTMLLSAALRSTAMAFPIMSRPRGRRCVCRKLIDAGVTRNVNSAKCGR